MECMRSRSRYFKLGIQVDEVLHNVVYFVCSVVVVNASRITSAAMSWLRHAFVLVLVLTLGSALLELSQKELTYLVLNWYVM